MNGAIDGTTHTTTAHYYSGTILLNKYGQAPLLVEKRVFFTDLNSNVARLCKPTNTVTRLPLSIQAPPHPRTRVHKTMAVVLLQYDLRLQLYCPLLQYRDSLNEGSV